MPQTAPPRSRCWLLLPLLAVSLLRSDLANPRDRSDLSTRAAAAGTRSFLFLSPNADEDLSSDEAVNRLQGAEQADFRRFAAELVAHAGMRHARVVDALGDWSDGMENSLLVDLAGAPDMSAMQYAASLFGLRARQKSVLVFRAEVAGEDELATLHAPDLDLGTLRHKLDEHGIPFRTIAPTFTGHRIVVVDQRRQWHDRIARLAADLRVRVDFLAGRSVSLGAESRAEARSRFHRVIGDYERRMPRPTSAEVVIGPQAPGPVLTLAP